MRRYKLREVATVFVGNCPACDDMPDGEWFDGSEFEHYCGYTLVAVLTHDKDGADHWRFDFAFEDEAKKFRRARPLKHPRTGPRPPLPSKHPRGQ